MLAGKKIDLNALNNNNDTPLIVAAKHSVKENGRLFQKLLEFGADPTFENNQGESFYSLVSKHAETENFAVNSTDWGNMKPEKKQPFLLIFPLIGVILAQIILRFI